MHTPSGTSDADLIGAEVAFGATPLGRIQAVLRDPLSQRVRHLVMRYGAGQRRVAVPMEWVVRRSRGRLVLGVGTRSLDDLADQPNVGRGLAFPLPAQ
jgi:hypothetical protein